MWLCVGIEITPAKEIPNESAMVAAARLNSLNSASIYNQTRNKSINYNSTFCLQRLLFGTSSLVTRLFGIGSMQLSQPRLGQSKCTRYMFMCREDFITCFFQTTCISNTHLLHVLSRLIHVATCK